MFRARLAWFAHWASAGMAVLETRLTQDPETGDFCHGDCVGLADLCFYAQVLNNARFGVDMTPYPTIQRIYANCMDIPALERAAPVNQPDAF